METINYIVSLMSLQKSNMQPESQNQQMEKNNISNFIRDAALR